MTTLGHPHNLSPFGAPSGIGDFALCGARPNALWKPQAFYKRLIEFREQLPKTLVGKVAYRVLEEEELAKIAKEKESAETAE